VVAVAIAQPRVFALQSEGSFELRAGEQAEGAAADAVESVGGGCVSKAALVVVDLLQERAPRAQAIDRHFLAQVGVGQKRGAQPHRPAAGRRRWVQHRPVRTAHGIVAFAQEAAHGPGRLSAHPQPR